MKCRTESSLHIASQALLLALHVNPAFSQERKVNIAYAGPSLIALPFLAAHEWKLFSQNGLSAQLIAMTFTISIPALSAEQVEYLGGVGPATVSATLEEFPRARSGSRPIRSFGL